MRGAKLIGTLLVAATAAVASGCGGGGTSSNGAAVRVDGAKGGVIDSAAVDHWMHAMAGIALGSNLKAPVEVPDAPRYSHCVASTKKAYESSPTAPKTPSDSDLRKQCSQRYAELKSLTLGFLIEARWMTEEANARGIAVKDADIQRQIASAKAQAAIKSDAQFRAYLAHAGMSHEDFLYRARIYAIADELRAHFVTGVGHATPAEIAAYFKANRAKLAQPERRDLLVVKTRTLADAKRAKSALRSGRNFSSVAKQFSVDLMSRAFDGQMPAATKAKLDPALAAAVFRAHKGDLSGPVHTRDAFWIFQVTKISPAIHPTLANMRAQIERTLIAKQQQGAIDGFLKQLRAKWQPRTHCSHGFIISDCAGMPQPKPVAAAGSGGT